MHVLLTGGSSFIGRSTTEVLSRAGVRVTATYRSEGKAINELQLTPNAPELIRLDLGNSNEFSQLPKTIDTIVHIAGLDSMPGVTLDDILHCNVNGTRNIQRYGLNIGASRLIYLSSLLIHGRITAKVVDETTPIVDPDVYGTSKYLGERLLASTADHLPVAAIRLPGVLGVGASRAWIPRVMDRLMTHQLIEIYNPDAPFNNAIHVLDLGNFILELLVDRVWPGFHAFPVAASGATTIGKVVSLLKEATGSRSQIIVRPTKQSSFTISSKYAVKHFGYKPKNISEILDRYSMEYIKNCPAEKACN